ncbi:SCO family protein [bacterium]|nr:SCO family protein [bacterium]
MIQEGEVRNHLSGLHRREGSSSSLAAFIQNRGVFSGPQTAISQFLSISYKIFVRGILWGRRGSGPLFSMFLAVTLLVLPGAYALEDPGKELKEVGLSTVNGTELDLTLEFVDEDGIRAPLREFLSSEKPNILIPAYYDCPRLCGLLLTGVTELLNTLTLTLGEDYRVVTVSFNPQDGPESAKRIASEFRGKLVFDATKANEGEWRFLSGDEENIVPLMKSLGFHYKEDEGEFAHVAAIFLLSPQGMISQHLAGINFPYRDVRLALVEASQGKIGTLLDRALLFCYRFDDLQGKYTWAAFGFVRTGAGMTLLALVLFFGFLRKRESPPSK